LVDFLEFCSVDVDFIYKTVVFTFKLLILVTLLWVEIVETRLVGIVDLLNLLLIAVQLVFHVLLLRKQPVEMSFLLLILVFDVRVQVLDVFWLSVTAVLV